ncbi:hypothetical protein COEREDRAFT_13873 [Coemansia reversa NRRL 1564]|uniref:Uncharacterized protein n=1 Tax=Coemansia reversa (strain ATCC 12441 / NRRL 1564) TaxID=763665 RepID=A0A2G5BH13_COERN|nr:hypothetical protein COEREDRAFT_13873 [Coemansia reversa NRRL 1564]|eukprot:PIA18314.1 hypothetical protein COEREDRAFT_13873 [Coemansia reversa NRRL 1564]
MPILTAVIDSLDALGDELCALNLSRPRYNLTALGVKHCFEPDTRPSFLVRNAEPHEAKLVAPGTKGVYEDMLSRIGVQHANLGVEADKELDSQAFEEFYDKTVDLADLCQLPDVNDRLNQVANSYQEFALQKEELSGELKRLAVIPRIKQRLSKLPQMQQELEDMKMQRRAMESEATEHAQALDAMEKDISYLRAEHSMDQESEEQAVAQLNSKKEELERLKADLETKKRLLLSRKEAYQKSRPLTALEHVERMLGELQRFKEAASQEDGPELQSKSQEYMDRLSEIISSSDAIDLTNHFLNKVFANTIDSVANEDVESMEARRASRRLSMTISTPSGRVLAAQILCILYAGQGDDSAGMTEDDLRTRIMDFAREHSWNPDLVVQAMYEVFGKKLAKRYRDNRTHMVHLLWE